jgi:hypothetical protein
MHGCHLLPVEHQPDYIYATACIRILSNRTSSWPISQNLSQLDCMLMMDVNIAKPPAYYLLVVHRASKYQLDRRIRVSLFLLVGNASQVDEHV